MYQLCSTFFKNITNYRVPMNIYSIKVFLILCFSLFYFIYIDKPSKDTSHPDYAPSVSLGGTSSFDASSSVLSRHVRLTKHKVELKGLDAVEALLSLQ